MSARTYADFGSEALTVMKHPASVTAAMVALFLAAQYVGLLTVREAAVNPAFSLYNFAEALSLAFPYLPVALWLPVGALAVAIARRKRGKSGGSIPGLLRLSTAEASAFCLSITFWILFSAVGLPWWLAVAAGAGLGFGRAVRQNQALHDFAEIFVYGGATVMIVYAGSAIASLYSPPEALSRVLPVAAAAAAIVLISFVDYWAVRSGRMTRMARTALQAKAFPGLVIPYGKTAAPEGEEGVGPGLAAVGGGDIYNSLLFSSAVLMSYGVAWAVIVPIFSVAGLLVILVWGKSGRMHPAMPMITAGCLTAWLIILLANLF